MGTAARRRGAGRHPRRGGYGSRGRRRLGGTRRRTGHGREDREQLRAAAIASRQEAGALTEQVAALEVADRARARWYTETAVTRDKAERSAAELRARGVDPHDAGDRVTAEEWLDAARADQAADETDREIGDEFELHDAAGRPCATEEHLDVRDSGAAHPSERVDPAERWRVPTLDDTAEAIARAQIALAEIEERHAVDAERAAREAEEAVRAEEPARWAEPADDVDARAELDDAEPARGRGP